MRSYLYIILFFTFVIGNSAIAQENDEVLFRIGDNIIFKKDAVRTLSTSEDISIDKFNRVLNFYLSIHDFKERKADTTKRFRRSLETQKLNILGSIYSTQHYDNLINKCTVTRSDLAVVNDLFVPFEPRLLKTLNQISERKDSKFSDLVDYAKQFEGVSVSRRIIYRTETLIALNNAACKLLDNVDDNNYIGPVKSTKGYHYLELISQQENYGRYKTQVIYISDIEGNGKDKILEAYKKIKSGVEFSKVAKEYSQNFSNKDNAIKYFSPSINSNRLIEAELKKLTYDGALSKPFFVSRGWYIIKRLKREDFPKKSDLQEYALKVTRKPSFFIEELKERYNVKEFPGNFMTGKDEVLFLINDTAYYTKDLKKYTEDFGYNLSTDTYDKFLYYILVEQYKKEIDPNRYKRLLDDFYYLQMINPTLVMKKVQNKESFNKNLRKLVDKYQPIIPNKKYVENNPVFED